MNDSLISVQESPSSVAPLIVDSSVAGSLSQETVINESDSPDVEEEAKEPLVEKEVLISVDSDSSIDTIIDSESSF